MARKSSREKGPGGQGDQTGNIATSIRAFDRQDKPQDVLKTEDWSSSTLPDTVLFVHICVQETVVDDLRFQRPPDGNPYEIRFLHIPGALFCCLWTHTGCTNVHSNCHLQVPCDTFLMVETTD